MSPSVEGGEKDTGGGQDWNPPPGNWTLQVGGPEFQISTTGVTAGSTPVARPASQGPSRPSSAGGSFQKQELPHGTEDAVVKSGGGGGGGSCAANMRRGGGAPSPTLLPSSAGRGPRMPGQARSLMLARPPAFAAAAGGVSWRRPSAGSTSHSSAAPNTGSVQPHYAASVVAGAVASGRSVSSMSAGSSPTSSSQAVSGERRATSRGAAPSDNALVARMAGRLAQVERLNHQQAVKLARQSKELDMLRSEVEKLRGDPPSPSSELRSLQEERDAYKKQVDEMVRFLADYGWNWVGAGADGYESETGEPEAAIQQDAASRIPVDVQLLRTKVEDLNAMVESEGARIMSDLVGGAVRARLVVGSQPPIPLVVFEDGVKLGGHAFWQHGSRPEQLLLRDVLDGYFPYVLKDKYPDGVVLKVIDRMGWCFEDWLRNEGDADPELADHGSRLRPEVGRAVGRARGSAEPRTIARGTLRGGSAPPVSRMDKVEPICLLEAGRDPHVSRARLQVKMETGQRVVLDMEPTHTIGDLEDALSRWRAQENLPACPRRPLRTAFPPSVYLDRSKTLTEAGFVPSATLFVGAEVNVD